MARIGIEIPAGLVSDDTSYATKGSYRKADHVRFWKGRAEVVKGYERLTSDYVPGVVRSVQTWKDNINMPLVSYASNKGLFVSRGGGDLVDITPNDYLELLSTSIAAPGFGMGGFGVGPFGRYSGDKAYYNVNTWSQANLGEWLIANPRQGAIYLWKKDMEARASLLSEEDGAVAVPAISNWVLTTKERCVMAFGTNLEIGGAFNPLAIRWSDIDANITVWNTDATNSAGENVLTEGGAIISARNWADDIAVWTQTGLLIGSFTGSPLSIYSFTPVSGGVGLIGPNAAVVVGQTAFWVSPDKQIWSCPLRGAPQQIVCPIQEDSLDNISGSQNDKIFMSYIAQTGELRIDYPDSRDGVENSRYITLQLETGAWSQGKEVRTAMVRGTPLANPIGIDTLTTTLNTLTAVTDNTSAKKALLEAQANNFEYGGVNLASPQRTALTTGIAVQSLTWGDSAWGFVAQSAGETLISGTCNDLSTLEPNFRVAVSFKARVVAGGSSALVKIAVNHEPGLVENITTQEAPLTAAIQEFRYEGILLPTNLTTPTVNFDFHDLPSGVRVEITDIKIEQADYVSKWTPYPDDPNLFANYAQFIRTLKYEQTVSVPYIHEIGTSADGGPLAWFIETNDFALDEDYTAMLLKGFIPDFMGQQGNVNLTIYLRNHPQDEEEVVGPFVLEPGVDRVDFMATGKLVRFRLEGNGTPAALRIGRCMFDAQPAGTR